MCVWSGRRDREGNLSRWMGQDRTGLGDVVLYPLRFLLLHGLRLGSLWLRSGLRLTTGFTGL